MKYHPDMGGDEEIMKSINLEYEIIFEKVKNTHKNKYGEKYEKDTDEIPKDFIDLINELVRLNNIQIEIIGSFIWISGDTKPHKETLKSLGFKWHSKKKNWYRSPKGYKRFGKKSYSMNDLRNMYGVQYKNKINLKELKKTGI